MSDEAKRAFGPEYAALTAEMVRESQRRMLFSACPVAHADCLRCSKPAMPTDGYCSRYCREVQWWDYEQVRLGGWHEWERPGFYREEERCGPMTPEEKKRAAEEAFAAAHAALEVETWTTLVCERPGLNVKITGLDDQ